MMRPIAVVSLALVVLGATHAWPSATSPTLVVSAASGARADGRTAVTLEGTFDFANAVQVGYPLQIVVFQGTLFVRFPIGDAPRSGTSSLLADGQLDRSELTAFLAAGAAAPADVRIVTLTDTSAVVSLPADFIAGAATVQLVAQLAEGPVLSNPLALVLP